MPSTGPTPQPIKPDFNKAAKAMSKTQTPKLQGQQSIQAPQQLPQVGDRGTPQLPSQYGVPNLNNQGGTAAYGGIESGDINDLIPETQLDVARKFYL